MKWRATLLSGFLLLSLRGGVCQEKTSPLLAATPPMGWNSWDGYGTTINEDQFKTNAAWFAQHLKPYGWQYVIIDMEWFVNNPTAAGNSKSSNFSLDEYGRYVPPTSRFPSAANHAGFKPIADYVHSLGLKFGIHILRGIPKQAVEQNSPIEGSSFHARDAADTSQTCPWNPDNYGVDLHSSAAQAYYDSIAKLYASWEVDFIKVDCIASRPYLGDDIRMFSQALRKTGRPIVLSLSPGAAPLDKLDEMRQYAQMWRISDDVWDLWHSTVPYPQGLGDQFANVVKWSGKAEPGHWPDADMLPLGHLGPAPGWGQARDSKLTHDEQRTLMTLWCIFPSPLMIGGELPSADNWTVSLLTNTEVIAVDQQSTANHSVISTDKTAVWLADSSELADSRGKDSQYLAIFNLGDSESALKYEWKDLSLAGKSYALRNLWDQKDLGLAASLAVTLPPHGSVLYRITRQ